MCEIKYENSDHKVKKAKPIGADGHRQRMFERYLNSNNNAVNPRDIVEMLMFYPIRIRDTRDAAVMLMDMYDGDIQKLLDGLPDDICKADGVGLSCALFLNTVGEALRRIKDSELPEEIDLTSVFERIFRSVYTNSGKDEFWVAYLDVTGKLVSNYKLDIDYKSISPSDILMLLQYANHKNVTSIAVAHMTGSFCALPNIDDTKAARLLEKVLRSSNFTHVDYFVVNADYAISLSKMYKE